MIIGHETLDITLSVSTLRNTIEKVLGVWLPPVPEDRFVTIKVQFEINRARGGAIHIQPEGVSKNILDLPPERLKRLIQGIVWRDEHFRGKTIRAISESSKYSEAQVRKLITASLDIKSYSL
ncbi:MAG: hypothetical protein KDJ50_10765 [Alphaproteobacteria bacterium]|nr:hypothetical protein [Alphaproteobacteria bacterium]